MNRFSLFIFIFLLSACTSQEPTIHNPAVTDAETPVITENVRETTPPLNIVEETPPSSPTPLGITAEELENVSLQFWHPWMLDAADIVESVALKFNTENPYGINVSVVSHGNHLFQDIQGAVSSGTLPDVVAAPSFQIHSWNNFGQVIQDLNVYFYDPDWGFHPTDIEDFYSILIDQNQVNGKQLGLPAFASSAVILYNQSWARELGFESIPDTPSEFRTQACAAAASSTAINSNEPTGGWIASTDPSSIMGWIQAFGGNGSNLEVGSYNFDAPAVETAFDFIKTTFKSGCAYIPGTDFPDHGFASRQGLFLTTSTSSIPFIKAAFGSIKSKDEWLVIPFPTMDGSSVINLYTSSYAVLKSTPERQLAAWIFIKWISQPGNQAGIIERSGYLPTRESTVELLGDYAADNPQWKDAQDLMEFGKSEPIFGSWGIVRWILSDAFTALLNPEFQSEEIPLLIDELNNAITESHFQNP